MSGVQHKGWFTYEFVNQVVNNDFFIEIAEPTDDKLKLGKGKIHGMVDEIGGRNLVYSTLGMTNSDFDNELSEVTTLSFEGSQFSNGILHEMGHLWGLLHPWDINVKNENGTTFIQLLDVFRTFQNAEQDPLSPAGDLIRSNLMNTGGNPNLLLAPIGGGNTNLIEDQFGKIYTNFFNRNKQKQEDETK